MSVAPWRHINPATLPRCNAAVEMPGCHRLRQVTLNNATVIRRHFRRQKIGSTVE